MGIRDRFGPDCNSPVGFSANLISERPIDGTNEQMYQAIPATNFFTRFKLSDTDNEIWIWASAFILGAIVLVCVYFCCCYSEIRRRLWLFLDQLDQNGMDPPQLPAPNAIQMVRFAV